MHTDNEVKCTIYWLNIGLRVYLDFTSKTKSVYSIRFSICIEKVLFGSVKFIKIIYAH